MNATAAEVIAGKALWSVEQGDVLAWLKSLPDNACNLVMTSPPYTLARTYNEDGKPSGAARPTEEWVRWLVECFRECLRVCTGLVAMVVDDQTRNYRWGCGPALLMADLHRAGINLRKPCIYRRVGIPGSGGSRSDHADRGGGPDWLRSDFEWIIIATRGGKLPWADGTACGHPPKWAPGGAMSNRLSNGTRVNQWGGHETTGRSRKKDGSQQPPGRPSHVTIEHGADVSPVLPGMEGMVQEPESGQTIWGNSGKRTYRLPDGQLVSNSSPSEKRKKSSIRPRTKRMPDDSMHPQDYSPPVLANPGSVIQETYTAEQVADILGESSDVIDCMVGGGQLGSPLASLNEAPFSETLATFFVRTFCPPGGVCLDPFSGSGTTGGVAVREGRRFVGCDLRASQVAISHRRIQGETPSLFSTPAPESDEHE